MPMSSNDCHWIGGNYGVDVICPAGHAAVGSCEPGAHPDCAVEGDYMY